MSKQLVMSFINEEGKKSSISVNDVKKDITEAQVSEIMNLIISKNIFHNAGGDLKTKSSAQIVDKTSQELKVK